MGWLANVFVEHVFRDLRWPADQGLWMGVVDHHTLVYESRRILPCFDEAIALSTVLAPPSGWFSSPPQPDARKAEEYFYDRRLRSLQIDWSALLNQISPWTRCVVEPCWTMLNLAFEPIWFMQRWSWNRWLCTWFQLLPFHETSLRQGWAVFRGWFRGLFDSSGCKFLRETLDPQVGSCEIRIPAQPVMCWAEKCAASAQIRQDPVRVYA